MGLLLELRWSLALGGTRGMARREGLTSEGW